MNANGILHTQPQPNSTNATDADDDNDEEVSVGEEVDEDALLQLTPPAKPSMQRGTSNLEPLKLAGDNAMDRLDYLLKQTEQFANLVKPKQKDATQSTPGRNRERMVGLLLKVWNVE